MAPKKDPTLAMFATALEFEEKGGDFYADAVKKCQNNFGRDVFDMLRRDEIVHIKRINLIHKSISDGKGWTDEWSKQDVDTAGLIKTFKALKKSSKKTVKTDSDDVAAAATGVKLERASIKFYKEHLNKIKDEEGKRFLVKMIDEEQNHLAALLDMKDFLEDPAAWHLKKERARPV